MRPSPASRPMHDGWGPGDRPGPDPDFYRGLRSALIIGGAFGLVAVMLILGIALMTGAAL